MVVLLLVSWWCYYWSYGDVIIGVTVMLLLV